MRKYKFFIDFDKEERWLQEMAEQGYRFVNKKFGYEFVATVPENMQIRIDYRTFKSQADYEDYCALFEDSGWVKVAGTRRSGHQYFSNRNNSGDMDIFSDYSSKASRYKRLSKMWFSLALSYVPILVVFAMTGMIDLSELLHPKDLYYTPGLWEKSGGAFWQAFLFETPFALMRGFLWLIFPLIIILYGLFAMLAKIKYKSVCIEH